MPRRPVLCLGVAVALFTATILCFVQTAKFQPKRPDSRHHACMSANEFVNMAQTILGVTTFDENVTKVARAIMEKAKEKAIIEKELELAIMEKEMWKEEWIMAKEMEKEMVLKEMEMEDIAAARYRHLHFKYLSVSSRFWLEQLFSDFLKFAQSRFSWKTERSMTQIYKFLVSNDTVWQQFVANESLSLTPPVHESFPYIPPFIQDFILYGALSEKVHQPPVLVVLNLTDPPYMEHIYLLCDLGVHYSKKLNLCCESVDLSLAIGDLMRRDLK